MIVRKKENVPVQTRADGVQMTDFFGDGVCLAGGKVSMGYAVFPPGTDVPPAAHEQDEYSYIISGRVQCEGGGTLNEFGAGDACFIPAGEVHASRNNSDEAATLVWMLIEK